MTLPALSPTITRRLALTRQRLAGPRPAPNTNGIMDVMRDLGCLQLDPTSAVERSHRLVLFSRVGPYDLAHLDTLLWQERKLFEYWAHCASIVLTENYPIHNVAMRYFAGGMRRSKRSGKARKWLEANQDLRRHILAEIRRRGPLPSRYFEDKAKADWYSTGWTSNRNVSQMLSYLWMEGRLMVAGREGIQKLWDLAARVLPEWTPRERITERESVRRSAQKSLRALGVATPRQIQYHFIRGGYPGLALILAELEREGRIQRVEIKDGREAWPGEWYIHSEDLPLLDQLKTEHATRTTLLSPFDNLICDRARTRRLFDFDYTMEIYVPEAKRKYGYYVLPILHGDRLIGRLDPKMDRERGQLVVNAVFAEPDAPANAGRAVARAVEDLAAFLGAREILYNRKRVPSIWKRQLQ